MRICINNLIIILNVVIYQVLNVHCLSLTENLKFLTIYNYIYITIVRNLIFAGGRNLMAGIHIFNVLSY